MLFKLHIHTVITLIIQTIQLFEHPPFPAKRLIIVFQAFEHPRLKLLFQYPNTYTLRSSNGGRRTSTSLRQPLWSYSESCRMSSNTLQVFSNVYQATKVVPKSTRLLLSLWSLNEGCQTCTSLRQSLWSLNRVAKRVLTLTGVSL